MASAGIVCSVRNRKDSLIHPTYRFLLVMSMIDIINSISLAVSSTAIPRGEYYGSIGNNKTCSTQGFLIQFGFAVPFYNASLSIFAFLTICNNYGSERFARRIEPICHSISLFFPLLTAVVISALGLFHGGNKDGGGHWCWIYVNESHQDMDRSREEIARVLIVVFGGIPLALLSLVVYICMARVYLHVRRQDATHNFLGGRSNHFVTQRSSTARQTLLYSGAFFFTHVFSNLSNILQLANVDENSNAFISLLVLQSIFYPLQGLWNFFIYTSPIVVGLQRCCPEIKMAEAFRLAVFNPPSCSYDHGNPEILRGHQRLSIKTAAKHEVNNAMFRPELIDSAEHTRSIFERIDRVQSLTVEIELFDKKANEENSHHSLISALSSEEYDFEKTTSDLTKEVRFGIHASI